MISELQFKKPYNVKEISHENMHCFELMDPRCIKRQKLFLNIESLKKLFVQKVDQI
jgi:hypothetical protein